VVLSLSKLKTHEKVGITCGLKGFVGSVGHKDCLAHHRFGSPSMGGDEFPDSQRAMVPFSRLMDFVNRRSDDAPLQRFLRVVTRMIGRASRSLGFVASGAWYGNDTCWRMTLDLARILHYADRSGRMQEEPQRRHLSLIDGIVAGEGNGPLSPTPAHTGTLLFGDDVVGLDRIACRLMGFDPSAIPLIADAYADMAWPIAQSDWGELRACVRNGEKISESALTPILGRPFVPPRGWRGHVGHGSQASDRR